MPAADTARLIASLEMDNSKFLAGAAKANVAIGRIDKRLGAFSGAVNRNLSRLVDSAAIKGVQVLTNAFTGGVAALKEDAVVAAQTAAVIKSTGGAAGVTAAQVAALADKLSVLDGVQDNVVQQTENLLLTFTNIGRQGGVFDQATQAVIDMSAALGQDTKASAIQLGKALNDPLKGITALQRVGVTFNKQQKDTIADLIKHNKLREAQAIILKEVQKEFGGVAKAQADADPSKRLGIAIEKIDKAFASGLLPAVENIQRKLTDLFNDPNTIKGVKDLGNYLGDAADQAIKFVEGIPWDKVTSGLRIAAGFAKNLVDAFVGLPPEAQATIIALAGLNKLSGGAVTSIIGDLSVGLGKWLSRKIGLMTVQAGVVEVNGAVGGGGIPGAGPAGETGKISKLGRVADLLSKAVIVGLVAEAAQALDPIASQIAKDLHNQFLSALPQLPKADQLQWPFGPKNTPTILPELFGGNGLLGGTAAGAGGDKVLHKLNANDPLKTTGEHARITVHSPELDKMVTNGHQLLAALHDANREGKTGQANRLREQASRLIQRINAAAIEAKSGMDKVALKEQASIAAEDRIHAATEAGFKNLVGAVSSQNPMGEHAANWAALITKFIPTAKLPAGQVGASAIPKGEAGHIGSIEDRRKIVDKIGAAASQAKAGADKLIQKGEAAISVQDRIHSAAERGVSATNNAASTISAAIRAAQPIITTTVNVTGIGIQAAVTTSDRYGPAGSRRGGSNDRGK